MVREFALLVQRQGQRARADVLVVVELERHVALDLLELGLLEFLGVAVQVHVDFEELLDVLVEQFVVELLAQRALQLVLDLVQVQRVRVVHVQLLERGLGPELQHGAAVLQQQRQLLLVELAQEGRLGADAV